MDCWTVIGVVVACALIAFAATWYTRRRWRQKGSTGADSPEHPHYMAELYQEPNVVEAPSGAICPGPFELPATKHR
jgi:hypothetical protein